MIDHEREDGHALVAISAIFEERVGIEYAAELGQRNNLHVFQIT